MGRRRWTFAAAIAAAAALAAPGTALAATANPTSLRFDNVRVGTAATPQTVTITREGLDLVSFGPPSVSGPGFSIAATTCTSGTPAGGTCTVSVTFTPGAAGPASGTLTVPAAQVLAGDSTATVSLTGTGIQPGVALATATLAGGQVQVGQQSAALVSAIKSTGTAPLAVSSITVGGANPGDFAVGYCAAPPFTLDPGTECYVGVLFKPTSAGDKSASIVVETDAGQQVITLTGTGVQPPAPPPGNPPPPPTVDIPGGGSTVTGAPKIAIKTPKRNATVTRSYKRRVKGKLTTLNKAVIFKGTASDTDGLARVEVALVKGTKVPGSPRFKRAKLDDFSWSYAIPTKDRLSPGTYTLVARATDIKGVRSTVTVTFKLK